jgi:hypothetical protein
MFRHAQRTITRTDEYNPSYSKEFQVVLSMANGMLLPEKTHQRKYKQTLQIPVTHNGT